MSTLVDTAAFYALADRRDQHHQEARQYYVRAAGSEGLLTTDYILVESWMLIAHRLGRTAAMRFWDRLSTGMIPLLGILAQDLARARQIAHEWEDQGFSLVDCASMAIMERMAIGTIFTFDDDFDRYRYGTAKERFFTRVPAVGTRR